MNPLTLPHLLPQLESILHGYESYHHKQIQFGKPSPVRATPEKPYTARTNVPILYENQNCGDIAVLIFAPGDGTGDTSMFQAGTIEVPPKYHHDDKPHRVFPRAKERVISEGYLPLFAIRDDTLTIPYAGCLEELTVRDGKVVRAWGLGQFPHVFSQNVESGHGTTPNVTYTCGLDDRTYFGDPHALYNATNIHQVAGFLTITWGNNQLNELRQYWKIPKLNSPKST